MRSRWVVAGGGWVRPKSCRRPAAAMRHAQRLIDCDTDDGPTGRRVKAQAEQRSSSPHSASSPTASTSSQHLVQPCRHAMPSSASRSVFSPPPAIPYNRMRQPDVATDRAVLSNLAMQQSDTGILPAHPPVVSLSATKLPGESSTASQQGDNRSDVRSQTESLDNMDELYVPKDRSTKCVTPT